LSIYRVMFTPMEPYFFGNEKTFRFDARPLGQYDTPYYIRSEKTPLQTTVFGAIRYLLLKNRQSKSEGYPIGYERIIGEKSWNITESNQEFGIINNISPIFLYNQNSKAEERIYVPAPFNHYYYREREKDIPDVYTPFSLCDIKGDTRQYAPEFEPKEFLFDGFINIDSGEVVRSDAVFNKTVRVGIDVNKRKSAFFKKEYCYLSEGWSFGIYLDVKDSEEPIIEDSVVYLGQSKAAFKVDFNKEENKLEEKVKKHIANNSVYCMSDVYTSNKIYEYTSFSVTQIRDYRAYNTIATGETRSLKIKKDDTLYRLVKAGSVLCFNDMGKLNDLKDELNNKHCQTIGMDSIVIGEKSI